MVRCIEVEVASQGKTVEEALENLREALELQFEDDPSIGPIISPIITSEVDKLDHNEIMKALYDLKQEPRATDETFDEWTNRLRGEVREKDLFEKINVQLQDFGDTLKALIYRIADLELDIGVLKLKMEDYERTKEENRAFALEFLKEMYALNPTDETFEEWRERLGKKRL